MNNFNYSIPTKVYFGKGKIKNLGRIAKSYGEKALLVYGGGSIKSNGIYDAAVEKLKEAEVQFVELSGVEPNPRITSVEAGVKLCRENKVDMIIPIGGGSTIDCAKAIAAAVYYEGDSWDIVKDCSKITKALPIISILTLAATGSEMDAFAVISNMDTNEKLGMGHELLKPQASILDPEYTFTVSKYQTAAGTADIMSHIFEAYFTTNEGTYLPDRMAEAMLKTCIKYGPIAMEDPENYEARANLMWTSSLAINGLISFGKTGEWSVHGMEHELSAFYDITHGVGLAILTPHWMRYVLNDNTLEKFTEYGVNVWDIDKSLDKKEIANLAIDKTAEFFKTMGIPTTLREVGIDEEKLEIMAQQAVRFGMEDCFVPLKAKDVLSIFKAAL
ncbi:MAG: iron-containing alcohol dehydrogenase [Clostridium sp.]